MTLVAHLVGNRDMDGVIQKAAASRTVGIMAHGAGGICHGVILMDRPEKRLVGLMAVFAESGHVLLEETEARGRPVRIVAGQTPRGHGLVFAFRLVYFRAQFFVA